MCIHTFSRCIILPAKYALNTKCCHWKQHGRPAGFSASFSEPSWDLSRWTCLFGKHFLTVLRAWAGSFKCLFRASARRFVSPTVKPEKTESSRPGENVQRDNLQWIIYKHGCADHQRSPVSLKQAQSRIQVFLEEGNGENIKWENSPNWHTNTEGKEWADSNIIWVMP